MNAHPDVWVHPETHWVPRMFEFAGLAECDARSLIRILAGTTHTNGARVTPVDDADLDRLFSNDESVTVREFADRVGDLLARRAGKSMWADKVPDYGFFMQQLQLIWPECRFIHLIRDGRDVALSMSKHPGFQWIVTAGEATWCSAAFRSYFNAVDPVEQPLSAYAGRWNHSIRRIRDEATRIRPGTYREVRYEAILSDPEAVMAELAAFAGIDTDAAWLEGLRPHIRMEKLSPRRDSEVEAAMSGAPGELMLTLGYD
jgi:hypothetical protein